jgi:SAM-dependent methyltransferase
MSYFATRLRAFSEFKEYESYHRDLFDHFNELEHFVSRQKTHPILVERDSRLRAVKAKVSGGAYFGNDVNLREGLITRDGLNSRARLLRSTLLHFREKQGLGKSAQLAFFEDDTPLAKSLRKSFVTTTSLYAPARPAVHQDICSTDYVSERFDFVAHSDVLEHVPNFSEALKDNFRILKSSGVLVFTVPFFPIPESIVRAELVEGEVKHHLPLEMHGDPLNPQGILAYYNFGFDLLDEMRAVGFSDVYVLCCYAPELGFFSNHRSDWSSLELKIAGNMLPLSVVGHKMTL